MKRSSQFIGFLAWETKTAESSLYRTSKGLTGSLAVGAFNAWQVTVVSTGGRPDFDQEGVNINREEEATGWEKVFFALLDRTSTEQGQPVDRFPNRLSRLARASIGSAFWSRKHFFFHFFSFLTLRQGL